MFSELLEEKDLNHEKQYDTDSGDYGDEGDIHRPISGSYFDLTFKPTEKLTYKTIIPQVN